MATNSIFRLALCLAVTVSIGGTGWADNWVQDNFDGPYSWGIADGWIPYHSGSSLAVIYAENTSNARSGSCQEIFLDASLSGEHGIIRPISGLTPNVTYGVEVWLRFEDGLGNYIDDDTSMEFRITWDDAGRVSTPGSESQLWDDDMWLGPGDIKWLGGGKMLIPGGDHTLWWHYYALMTTDSDGSGSVGLLWQMREPPIANPDADGFRFYVDDLRIMPTYVATQASVTPTLDGVWSAGEYDGGAVYNIMFSGAGVNLRYAHNGGTKWNEIMNPSDCSGVVTFVWDSDALYVSATVTDANILWYSCGINNASGYNTWEDDAVEVIIDGNHDESYPARDNSEYENGGGQVVVTCANSTRDIEGGFDKGVDWWGAGANTASAIEGAGTYTTEFRILWSKILESTDGTANLGDVIGITIGVDDDDVPAVGYCDNCGNGQLFQPGCNGFIQWVSSGAPWNDESQWGDLRITDSLTEIALPGSPLAGVAPAEWMQYR